MSAIITTVTKVTFRAFDQILTEHFVDKDDLYIHESLAESCETYQIISKEVGVCSLGFASIQKIINLQKASV